MPTPAEWIADGTATSAPVTVETPAPEVAPEAVAPPAAADLSAASDTASQAAAVDAAASAAATAAGATPAEAAAAGAQAAQDFIEGRLNDQPFQIPKGVQIPWKRGTESGFIPLEEAQNGYMRDRDYRIKTGELAQQRRDMEVQRRVETARNEALRQQYEEQQARIKAAYDSPEEQARHEAFLTQYRTDPYFKRVVDDAAKGRVLEAERAAVAEYDTEQAQVDAARQVAEAITAIGQKFPDVDPDYVRQRYARALEFENAPLSQAAIESIYREEAARIEKARGPLAAELAELRAQVASLQSGQAAAAHNSTTRQQIERAVTPIAAPVGGAPPAPVAPALTLTGKSLPDRSREWARQR